MEIIYSKPVRLTPLIFDIGDMVDLSQKITVNTYDDYSSIELTLLKKPSMMEHWIWDLDFLFFKDRLYKVNKITDYNPFDKFIKLTIYEVEKSRDEK
jgi:hypothetical protein